MTTVVGSWRPVAIGLARVIGSWLPPAGPYSPMWSDADGTLTRRELWRAVQQSRARESGALLVCERSQRAALVQILAGLVDGRQVHVISPRAGRQAIEKARAAVAANHSRGPGVRVATSGTQGVARLVQPRVGLGAVAQTLSFIGRMPHLRHATIASLSRIDHGHGFGLFVLALLHGGHHVALERQTSLTQLKALPHVDLLSGVPTQLADLCDDLDDQPPATPIGAVLSGSDMLTPELLGGLQRVLNAPVGNAYGATETSTTCLATPADLALSPDTVGRPLAGVRITERDGRLLITSPMLRGETFDADAGWVSEAGLVHITGRADGTRVTGGEVTDPDALRAWLLAQPGIVAVAITHVADARFGSRPTLNLKASTTVSEQALRMAIRDEFGPALTPVSITVEAAPSR